MNNLMLNYLKTDSPSTYEVEAQKFWLREAGQYGDEFGSDIYGNAFVIYKTKNKFRGSAEIPKEHIMKVVVDAHCDEISWVVKSIDDNGLIRVLRNGGTDNDITIGQKIKIIINKLDDDKHIKIPGFFGWIPIHLKKKEKPDKPNNDNLFIDIGVSSKDEAINLGVDIGNFIVMDREPEILNGKYIVGKSLDDKIGGIITMNLIRKLYDDEVELPFDLYLVNSVQEEIGLRGAKMITNTIKPDVAICFDPTFDTNTPLINKKIDGDYKLGDGLVFRQGGDVNHKLLSLMKEISRRHGHPYKVCVGGAGGTNTTAYNISNGGIPSAIASIPLRYMHTPNEMVDINDVKIATDFLVDLLMSIEDNHNFKLF